MRRETESRVSKVVKREVQKMDEVERKTRMGFSGKFSRENVWRQKGVKREKAVLLRFFEFFSPSFWGESIYNERWSFGFGIGAPNV